MAVQTDGHILICGSFNSIGTNSITNIARLNSDGSLDQGFNPGTAADVGYVTAVAVQSDGKVVLGGKFFSSSSEVLGNVARLKSDGTSDTGFNSVAWADSPVNVVVVQADGKLLLGGAFSYVNGYARRSIARLNADGSLDLSFDACIASSSGSGATGLALQDDGRMLASGRFTFSTGYYRDGIARLGLCGELDPSYAPPPGVDLGSTAFAVAMRPGAAGASLAGNFRMFGGVTNGGVVRLTTNGLPDGTFNSGSGINEGGTNFTLLCQPNGKLILAGEFNQYNGQPCSRLARVNTGGSLDVTFDVGSGPNNSVSSLALQPDGKILVAGRFSLFDGASRNGLARIAGDPVPARLGLPQRQTNGQIQLALYGQNQSHYAIQASTDLTNWFPVTNTTETSNVLLILDPELHPGRVRFYRALSLP